MTRTGLRGARRRGGALVAALVLVVVCAAIAGSTILTNLSRQKEADSEVSRERAFALAEAGLDWGIAQVREAGASLPAGPETGTMADCGEWRVQYVAGNANGRDDDGDGTSDESDEGTYTAVLATGRSGLYRRTLEVLLHRPLTTLAFDAATQLNVDAPIVDVNGNAFRISGAEHLIDGSLDATRPPRYGIASPADADVIIDQVPSNRHANITGLGGTPSVGQVPPIDLDAIADQATRAATTVLPPGTYSGNSWGTPVLGGTVVVYSPGDLHLSGGTVGAGVLVVDGDLQVSGDMNWIGIIIVRGRATMVGGGATKRLLGTLVVGEEVDSVLSGTEVTITGTVDLFYSSDAITLATQALSVPVVAAWREVGSP